MADPLDELTNQLAKALEERQGSHMRDMPPVDGVGTVPRLCGRRASRRRHFMYQLARLHHCSYVHCRHPGLPIMGPVYCPLCDVTLEGNGQYLMHKDGKKHKKKLRAQGGVEQPAVPALSAVPEAPRAGLGRLQMM